MSNFSLSEQANLSKIKYKSTIDIEIPIDIEKNCVDMLFENDITSLLDELTCQKLFLYHIQIRKTLPGSKYLGWHRDSYF